MSPEPTLSITRRQSQRSQQRTQNGRQGLDLIDQPVPDRCWSELMRWGALLLWLYLATFFSFWRKPSLDWYYISTKFDTLNMKSVSSSRFSVADKLTMIIWEKEKRLQAGRPVCSVFPVGQLVNSETPTCSRHLSGLDLPEDGSRPCFWSATFKQFYESILFPPVTVDTASLLLLLFILLLFHVLLFC